MAARYPTINPAKIRKIPELLPEIDWTERITDYGEAGIIDLEKGFRQAFNAARDARGAKAFMLGSLSVKLADAKGYENPFGTQSGGSNVRTRSLTLEREDGKDIHRLVFSHHLDGPTWGGVERVALSTHASAARTVTHEFGRGFGPLFSKTYKSQEVDFEEVALAESIEGWRNRGLDGHKVYQLADWCQSTIQDKRLYGAGIAILQTLK
jgi:hypothetical protein